MGAVAHRQPRIYNIGDSRVPVTENSVREAIDAAGKERNTALDVIYEAAVNAGDILTVTLIDLSQEFGVEILRSRVSAIVALYGRR